MTSSSYSNDYSDSVTDDFDMVGPPAPTGSMHPRRSAPKATIYRKRQPGSNATVLVNESLPTQMINNPDVPDLKEIQVHSQGRPASSTPHIFEEEDSSFTSSTASRNKLFQTVYERWKNDDEAFRHTSASSQTSSSIHEQYQQDPTRIGSLIPDKNFHPQTALYGQPNNLSAELVRNEVMTVPLFTRLKQTRKRLLKQGRTTFEVVEEDKEYNYKYNINDGLHDNYHRKNSNDDIHRSPPASVHPPLATMPFPVHTNLSMNSASHNIPITSPRHINPFPFDDAKRLQILKWKKHTSPPETYDSSPARAVPDYTAPISTGSDKQFDSPLSSCGSPNPRPPRPPKPVACDRCYNNKQGCDRNQNGKCSNCVKSGNPCTMDRKRKRNTSPLSTSKRDNNSAPEVDEVSGKSVSDASDGEPATQTELGTTANTKDNNSGTLLHSPTHFQSIQNKLLSLKNDAQKKNMLQNKANLPNDEAKLREFVERYDVVEVADYMVWIPYDEFRVLEKIGEGGFAVVFKAVVNHRQRGRKVVALKRMKGVGIVTEQLRNELLLNIYLRFFTTSRRATPAVLGLSMDTKGRYILVMEYASGGDLERLLCNSPPKSWYGVWQIAVEITRRLQVIHDAGLIHNDLHPGNIVFIGNGDTFNPMIIDVGISHTVEHFRNQGGCLYGRWNYLPPEAFEKSHTPYTPKSDIYCLGTLLWMLTSRISPRGTAALPPNTAVSAGLREVPIPGTPKEYEKIYTKCWNRDPDKRPTINEVLDELYIIEMDILDNNTWLEEIPEAVEMLTNWTADSDSGSSSNSSSSSSRYSCSRYHRREELIEHRSIASRVV